MHGPLATLCRRGCRLEVSPAGHEPRQEWDVAADRCRVDRLLPAVTSPGIQVGAMISQPLQHLAMLGLDFVWRST